MSTYRHPLDVPKTVAAEYKKNFRRATSNSGNLLLFAGDQKLEHLNDDFVGPKINPEDANPEHLFQIASALPGGVFATHLGLINFYGHDYRNINYVVKLNGRTNINPDKDKLDSPAWHSVSDIVRFKKDSRLKIVGVGYTVYLGGENETKMLKEAATITKEAHQAGLLSIIWMYPRSSKIKDEENTHLIAGGAGVAAAIGADFVKVKYPYKKATESTKFKEVVEAAGRTRVICVGGESQTIKSLISAVNKQLKTGTNGLAVGRNLHQRSLIEAKRLGQALYALIYLNAPEKEALQIAEGEKPFRKKRNSKILFFF